MMRLHALRWHLEVLAWRHGLWGATGALLAAAALLLWLCWLPAQETELAQARLAERLGQASQGRQAGQGGQGGQAGQVREVGGAGRLARVGRSPASDLPQAEQAADGVARLFALAAEQGLQPMQADYRRDETGTVGRWQVHMPVEGAYPQLRRYLRAAQAIPGLSIDTLGLHRGSGATPVEARLSFSVWYAVTPAGEVRP